MTQKMKIMAAVDLSDYSATIVRYSVWLAMRLDADLVLVNVINQRDLDMVQRTMTGYEAFSFPNYLTEQVKDRETKMKAIIESVYPDMVDCSYLVQAGIPYRELLTAIESRKTRHDRGGHQGPQQPGRRGGRLNGTQTVSTLPHTAADDPGGF